MLDSVRKSVTGSNDQWEDDAENEWPSREEEKRGQRSRRNRGHCHHGHPCGDFYDDDRVFVVRERNVVWFERDSQDNDYLWRAGFGPTVLFPYSLPRYMLGDNNHQWGYFAKYPYFKNYYHMTLTPNDPEAKPYSGRIRFEYSEDFHELTRIGGQIQIDTASRFGFDSETHRFEELVGLGKRDSLCLGDFNFTYRFAQSEKANFRAGIGFNWIADSVDHDCGINLTYGFDFYPCKPWVFSTEFDLGTLGKSDLFRFRTTAGVMIHRAEAYVGYEYLDIGNSSYNGLISGICIHF